MFISSICSALERNINCLSPCRLYLNCTNGPVSSLWSEHVFYCKCQYNCLMIMTKTYSMIISIKHLFSFTSIDMLSIRAIGDNAHSLQDYHTNTLLLTHHQIDKDTRSWHRWWEVGGSKDKCNERCLSLWQATEVVCVHITTSMSSPTLLAKCPLDAVFTCLRFLPPCSPFSLVRKYIYHSSSLSWKYRLPFSLSFLVRMCLEACPQYLLESVFIKLRHDILVVGRSVFKSILVFVPSALNVLHCTKSCV